MTYLHSAEMEHGAGDRQQPDEARDSSAGDKPAPRMTSPEGEPIPEDSQPEPGQDTDEEDDWDDEDDDDNLPSFEFRVETAKLLIELDEDNHAAIQVCHQPGCLPCCVWQIGMSSCCCLKGVQRHSCLTLVDLL